MTMEKAEEKEKRRVKLEAKENKKNKKEEREGKKTSQPGLSAQDVFDQQFSSWEDQETIAATTTTTTGNNNNSTAVNNNNNDNSGKVKRAPNTPSSLVGNKPLADEHKTKNGVSLDSIATTTMKTTPKSLRSTDTARRRDVPPASRVAQGGPGCRFSDDESDGNLSYSADEAGR